MKVHECGEGPPLALLHGMWGDHRDWDPVIASLSRRYRVLAPDLPGFGDSEKPRREYTAEFFVESLRELLPPRGLTLAGHSFGGQIAALYALACPAAVDRLVLVASDGFSRFTQTEREWMTSQVTPAILAQLTPQVNRLLFEPMFVNRSPDVDRYLARQDDRLARLDYPDYTHALAATFQLSMSTSVLDRLGDIRQPAVLIWGEQDQVTPLALAREALKLLPRGELKILPQCGHIPQIDCPDRFLRAMGV